MKKPVKIPPADQFETGEIADAIVPTLVVEATESWATEEGNESMPSLNPPESSSESFGDSFGAGVWHNNKRVTALFSTNEVRNSWMSIAGTGWLKLANRFDSANEALTVLAAAAKVRRSPVNYLLDGGQVTEIYVW